MKINRDRAVEILLGAHEGFGSYWGEHLNCWKEREPGITNDFSVYVDYVVDLVLEENEKELVKALELIEQFILEGDDDVQYGATIGFLEGATNTLSHKDKKHEFVFTKYLKPKSREFCMELDRFWGTSTGGL